jgi:DNA-binding CsgD family transcriptional regulator
MLPNFYRAPGYLKVLRPLGMHHCMITMLVEKGALVGRWPLWRSEGMPPWSRQDVSFMQAAAPHIVQGLRIRQSTPSSGGLASNGFAPLQNAAQGAVLLDRQCRVFAIDPEAQAILAELCALDGRPANGVAGDGIRSNLAYVTELVAQMFGARGESSQDYEVPALRVWTHRTGITVRLRGFALNGDSDSRHFVAFLERGELETYRRQRVMLRWGLSPLECEILRFLAHGRRGRELAADIGIAPGTLKTHLSRLVEKTAVCSYAELRDFSVKLLTTPSMASG